MCARLAKRIESCKLNFAPVVLSIKNCLHIPVSWLNYSPVSNQNRKRKLFQVDRTARAARRATPRTVKQTYIMEKGTARRSRESGIRDESRRCGDAASLSEAAQSFIQTIEFYKKDFGDPKSHDEAVKETLQRYESRRQYVAGLQPQEVTWGHFAAVGEVNTDDGLKLWARVRKAANDELECGLRGAKVAGHDADPYALAQYLAIRDSFADQWQPQGGIESAMVEMLAVSYSF